MECEETINVAKQQNKEKLACVSCGKCFRKPSGLRRHEAVHDTEKRFKCTQCDRSFSQKSSLQRHQAHLHNYEKKYKCPKCQACFAQKSNLRAHLQRTHPMKSSTGASTAMYACTQCPCVFTKLNTFNRHKTTKHTGAAAATDMQLQNAFSDDPDKLAMDVMEQLKRLQNGMRPINEDTTLSTTSTVHHLQTAIIDEASIKVATLADKLNPARAPTLLSVQLIRRKDGLSYFVCEFCAKEFRKRYDFIRHRRTHTNERPYKCFACNKSFKTNDKLRCHSQIHVLDAEYGVLSRQHVCSICSERFDAVRQFDLHMRTHKSTHKLQHICSQCHATFSTRSAFAAHKHRSVDNDMALLERLLPAPIVLAGNEVNTTKTTVAKARNPTKRCLFCVTCGRLFSSQSALNVHHKIHSGHKRFVCVHCAARKYTTKAQLQRHLLLMHYSGQVRFRCVYCTRVFKLRHHCLSHMKGHLKRLLDEDGNATKPEISKSQRCHIVVNEYASATAAINAKFSELLVLPRKKRNLTTETVSKAKSAQPVAPTVQAKHCCTICLKIFRKPSDLQRHLRTHTKERPYQCDRCNKSFAMKSTLKMHREALHGDQPRIPVSCQVCGKLYASRKVLNVHLRLHTGARPFICEHCDGTFSTSGHRLAHIKAAHKKQSLIN